MWISFFVFRVRTLCKTEVNFVFRFDMACYWKTDLNFLCRFCITLKNVLMHQSFESPRPPTPPCFYWLYDLQSSKKKKRKPRKRDWIWKHRKNKSVSSNHFHEIIIRITRFAHKKQECLQHNKVNSSLASIERLPWANNCKMAYFLEGGAYFWNSYLQQQWKNIV